MTTVLKLIFGVGDIFRQPKAHPLGLVGKLPGQKYKIITWKPSLKFLVLVRKEIVMVSISVGWIPGVAISLG
jgi:hypothetical protein